MSSSQDVGNAAKMREALEDSTRVLCDVVYNYDPENIGYVAMRQASRNDAALSAPPRNCDVGTAEEQEARFRAVCNEGDCEDCPLYSYKGGSCELYWAQLPYEGGDNK